MRGKKKGVRSQGCARAGEGLDRMTGFDRMKPQGRGERKGE